VRNLVSPGYQGGFDIEIGCPTPQVDEEYGEGSTYLESLGVPRKGEDA
jgi:hypothetical protein